MSLLFGEYLLVDGKFLDQSFVVYFCRPRYSWLVVVENWIVDRWFQFDYRWYHHHPSRNSLEQEKITPPLPLDTFCSLLLVLEGKMVMMLLCCMLLICSNHSGFWVHISRHETICVSFVIMTRLRFLLVNTHNIKNHTIKLIIKYFLSSIATSFSWKLVSKIP